MQNSSNNQPDPANQSLISPQLLSVLANILEGVIIVNPQLQIQSVNAVAEKITNSKQADVTGKNYREVLHLLFARQENKLYPDVAAEAINNKENRKFEDNTILLNQNGERIDLSGYAIPILNPEGNVFGCTIIFRDTGEVKKVEAAKDELFSIAAHQLKTPLGSMRWNLDMLLTDYQAQISPDVKEVLTELQKSNIAMIQLVNDLLSIKRIEQGKLKDAPEMLNILNVIKNVINETAPLAKDKNVIIRTNVNNLQIPDVYIDQFRFHEVMANLISNGIKYNRVNGFLDINFVLQPEVIEISVKDNGIGISQASQQKIFSKYFRADNALSSKIEGTGLGLSIVKSFIEEWQGKIWFDSVENQGTTFYFTIPLKKPA